MLPGGKSGPIRAVSWTYRSQLTPTIAFSPAEIDESSGLAAAGPAIVPATVPSPSTVSSRSTPPSSDIVVRTEIVDRETIEETPVAASKTASAASRPTTQPPASTATTGKFVETIPSTAARNSSAPINPPPVLEAAAPSLDYAAPSTLPAMASTSTPRFIPSILPPSAESASASRAAVGRHGAAWILHPPPRHQHRQRPLPHRRQFADQSAAVRCNPGCMHSWPTTVPMSLRCNPSGRPSISALSRAFDNLTSQHVALQACTDCVMVRPRRANCSGTASWSAKWAAASARSARQWTFNLNQAEGGWRIVQVQALIAIACRSSLSQGAQRISRGARRGSLAEAGESAGEKRKAQSAPPLQRQTNGGPGWHCVPLCSLRSPREFFAELCAKPQRSLRETTACSARGAQERIFKRERRRQRRGPTPAVGQRPDARR